LAWLAVERIRDKHATSLGAASGIVAGLVAITPACAAVDIWGALAIGVIAGVLAALAVGLKYRFKFDDSLDVVAVHLVSGLAGTILIGFFAVDGVGLFYGGDSSQLVKQVTAALIVTGYSLVATLIIGLVISKVTRFRVTKNEEQEGVDVTLQAESAYDLEASSGGVR
jgi:Amt family ammonium transporter